MLLLSDKGIQPDPYLFSPRASLMTGFSLAGILGKPSPLPARTILYTSKVPPACRLRAACHLRSTHPANLAHFEPFLSCP